MFGFFQVKPRDIPESKTEVIYKDKELDDQELMLAFAEHFGDIGEYQVDSKEEARMFEELRSVDYLQTYLRAQIARDMQLYFAATTDQQRDLIKGRIARTAFFRSQLMDPSEKKTVKTKMKGLRYAR